MKAIETRYIPATNTRGSRIKAYAEGVKPLTIPYPYELSGTAVHAEAALALARRMGWTGTLVSGGKADQTGEVFCFLDSEQFKI
jgi:hypothetical protein